MHRGTMGESRAQGQRGLSARSEVRREVFGSKGGDLQSGRSTSDFRPLAMMETDIEFIDPNWRVSIRYRICTLLNILLPG